MTGTVNNDKKRVNHMNKKVKSLLVLIGMVVLVYLIFYISQPSRFGSMKSLYILLQQCMIPAVSACGFYFILTMGLFDFTLGANIILSALIGCIFSDSFGYVGLMMGCIIVGTFIGFTNGLMYLKFKIPSIIATIGLLIVYECIATYIGGTKAHVLAEDLRMVGQAPWNLIVAALAFLLAIFMIQYTRTGIYMKAIGRNEVLAKNMGVNAARYKVIGFTLCGLFAGIAALLTISYSTSIIPVQGMNSMNRNFTPLMGCFVGVAFKKYINPVISILVGEFLISMITTGVMTNGIDSSLEKCIVGVILLVIVVMMSRENRMQVVK